MGTVIGAALAMAALACLSYARNRSLHQGNYRHGRQVVAATAVTVVAVACLAVVIGLTYPWP